MIAAGRPSLRLAAATDLRLYHVTDSALSGGIDAVPIVVVGAVRGGAGAIQVRDKHATDADIAEVVRACRDALARELGEDSARIPIFVNDRLAVATELGCHLHVGQDDVSAREARQLLGPDLMLGLSAGSPEQVREALDEGVADLLGIGPFRATGTKPDASAPLGLAGLTACLAPWGERAGEGPAPRAVAIGGIDAGNAAEVSATGVDGVCVISAIAAAPDPAAAAAEILGAIERGRTR